MIRAELQQRSQVCTSLTVQSRLSQVVLNEYHMIYAREIIIFNYKLRIYLFMSSLREEGVK